ncbi:5-carboxymethyl-2-hydroxymuconate Delta-isomerase [Geothrix campi]|uniref:5-carboxymethyl-2-hydroxymuconate Delta-isomerase n=1 Tax=Geothrix campi TaxID=2966450 RepID=UPI002148095B|nr:5-carboxymethyl-2-hydroxymuconate Delta-isomerase [Geothrix sp. SG10]
MPHCILETSNNLLDHPDWVDLLRKINRALVATGLFTSADIKSRAIQHDHFVIGDGAADQAFVTLNVQILSGRTDEVKAQISEALLQELARAFPRSAEGMRLNLTVQISDLHRASYRRQTSG